MTSPAFAESTWPQQAAALAQSLSRAAISAPITANLDHIDWDAYAQNPLYSGIDGHGITIAIIDTGIDQNHAAFAGGRIAFQYDFVSGDRIAQDDNGHGSHVASIAGGYQEGVYAGVATGVNFVILKVLDSEGSGNGTAIRQALTWVDQNAATYNIAAVNMSLGFGVNDSRSRNDFLTSTLKSLRDKGVASVGAAGNDYRLYQTQGVDYPGSDPYSWAVGAVHSSGAFSDKLANFSQRSTTLMDMSAPGVSVSGARAGGGYVNYSGTSMATPAVTGAVALAQNLATAISGNKLDVDTVRVLMRAGAATITDNEIADGVRNTGQQYLRLDIDGMLDKVVAWFQTSTNGHDELFGWRGDDHIFGGAGDDTISGGEGADTLDGGDGTDTADFRSLSSTSLVNNADGTYTVAGDLLRNFEYARFSDRTVSLGETTTAPVADPTPPPTPPSPPATGPTEDPATALDPAPGSVATMGNDLLFGKDGRDSISGLDGNDTIYGRAGTDILKGGMGNDVIHGDDGNDRLIGDFGDDVLYGGAGNDRLEGGLGANDLDGGDGFDVAVISGTRAGTLNVFGTELTENAVTVNVLRAIETVVGSRYDDRIIGDATNTTLLGAAGRDTIDGGAGDDTLDGGAGRDLLTGGDGEDRFIFSTGWGADTIADVSAADILDFRAVRNLTNVEQFTLTELSNGLKIEVPRGGSVELQGIDKAAWNAMLADGHILL